MIKITNVFFEYYKNHKLLENVSITLTKKKIGVIGSNGSGKSTLLKLIKGLLNPSNGNIEIDNKLNLKDKVRKDVGLIFQNPDNQIIFPIVEDDLLFGLKNTSLSESQKKEKIDKILSLFSFDYARKKKSYNLSGGEKQILSILGILLTDPKYFLFDEPTAYLDLKNKKKIFDIIHSLDSNVIVATHDLDFLTNFDEVVIFDKGKILDILSPNLAIQKYKSIV